MEWVQYNMHDCHCDRAPNVEDLSKVTIAAKIPKYPLSQHVYYLVDGGINQADQEDEGHVVLFERLRFPVVQIVLDVDVIYVV